MPGTPKRARKNGKNVEKRQWRSPRSEVNSKNAQAKVVEKRDPERAADVVMNDPSGEDPIKRFMEAAESCGMPKGMALSLKKRMETRYLPASESLRAVNTGTLIQYLDDRALKALEYMDDAVFAEAPLRDLAVSMGILIEKRQLLRGEPTQILTIEERSSLDDLIPLIVDEAHRRGMTIDNNPMRANDIEGEAVTVLPQEPQRSHDRAQLDQTYARIHGYPVTID